MMLLRRKFGKCTCDEKNDSVVVDTFLDRTNRNCGARIVRKMASPDESSILVL